MDSLGEGGSVEEGTYSSGIRRRYSEDSSGTPVAYDRSGAARA